MEIFLAGLYMFLSHMHSTIAINVCKWNLFTHEPGYDNVAINDSQVWQLGKIALPQCMRQCLTTKGCFSIQYTPDYESCVAFRKFYTDARRKKRSSPPPLPEPDVHLYNSDKEPESECVGYSDCAGGGNCILGMCYCDSPAIGYSRDGHTCRPLTECIGFSKDFVKFPQNAILGHDLGPVAQHSAESCQQLCLDNYSCKGVEFISLLGIGICFVKVATWYDVLQVYRRPGEAGVNMFQRDCDWKMTNALK